MKPLKEIIPLVSEEWNVEVIQIEKGDKYCIANGEDKYFNSSYCIGRTIYLGMYINEELKLISLFHELGHIIFSQRPAYTPFCKAHDYREVPIELECTRIGIEKALNKGIVFSNTALKWIYEQAFTYMKTDQEIADKRSSRERDKVL